MKNNIKEQINSFKKARDDFEFILNGKQMREFLTIAESIGAEQAL